MSRPHPLTPDQQLQQQLDDTSRALAAAQAGYDQCADQDLLEYYLYDQRPAGQAHLSAAAEERAIGVFETKGWEDICPCFPATGRG